MREVRFVELENAKDKVAILERVALYCTSRTIEILNRVYFITMASFVDSPACKDANQIAEAKALGELEQYLTELQMTDDDGVAFMYAFGLCQKNMGHWIQKISQKFLDHAGKVMKTSKTAKFVYNPKRQRAFQRW